MLFSFSVPLIAVFVSYNALYKLKYNYTVKGLKDKIGLK